MPTRKRPEPSGRTTITGTAYITKVPSHVKAGLDFPVARIHRYMKEGRLADRVSFKAAINIAALLEFLAAEVLELASESAQVQGKKRRIIKPRHINLAVRGDDELARLLGESTVIPAGGTIPYIQPELERKNKNKKKKPVNENIIS
jgi:histone H2A